jgi:hypothetical protein
MTIRTPLEAKVADILNERDLMITIGESQGVRLGMRFRVLVSDKIASRIGEPPGFIEKTQVIVTDVRPEFSICRTYRTSDMKIIQVTPLLAGLAAAFLVPNPDIAGLIRGI